MNMLDSRLRYLVAVAQNGSFTAAAKVAGVTQSAITRSIADLEKEIGFAIFHRAARGVVLTEKGKDFVDSASRLMEDARALLRGAQVADDPYAGVLRVGVAPAALEWNLADPLVELLKRHPGVRYDIASSSFESIVQKLRSGALDVAVGFDAAFSEWSDLRREPMGSLRSALFVRKGHPLCEKQHVTREELSHYGFVSPSDSKPYGEIIRSLYEDHGTDWYRHMHRADFFPTVRRLVENSDAIGVVALSYARSEQFEGRFKLLPGPDLFPVAPLCCAYRARWEPKAGARAFIGIVKRSFSGA